MLPPICLEYEFTRWPILTSASKSAKMNKQTRWQVKNWNWVFRWKCCLTLRLKEILMTLQSFLFLFLTLETQEVAWERKQSCRIAVARDNKARRSWNQCLHWHRYWARSVAMNHSSPNKMRRAAMRRRTWSINYVFKFVTSEYMYRSYFIIWNHYEVCYRKGHLQVQPWEGWRDEEWMDAENRGHSMCLSQL